ncbi:class I SAM-dependent methyltransferase [Streptomyces sp. NPDC127084]|uniref:class I SAM-dependent methyltransferase n=1 Tax=Streptomyces sp. NPDC127084 TaxID=3347133 RepID=UPI00365A1DF6
MDTTEEQFDAHAEAYDALYPLLDDDHPMITFIRDRLPPRCSVVEFGIGTGRVAIPLVHAGLDVCGIDLSARMLEKLAAKPEGARITTVHGSFTETRNLAASRHSAVICVFNTLFHVLQQREQARTLEAAAAALRPGGLMFLENSSAHRLVRKYPDGDAVRVHHQETGRVWLLAGVLDELRQRLDVTHIRIGGGEISPVPVSFRYVWPSELRLMAQAAGLDLVEEHGDWSGAPYDTSSRLHICVLRKPPV